MTARIFPRRHTLQILYPELDRLTAVIEALAGKVEKFAVYLKADAAAAQPLANDPGGSGAKEWVEYRAAAGTAAQYNLLNKLFGEGGCVIAL